MNPGNRRPAIAALQTGATVCLASGRGGGGVLGHYADPLLCGRPSSGMTTCMWPPTPPFAA